MLKKSNQKGTSVEKNQLSGAHRLRVKKQLWGASFEKTSIMRAFSNQGETDVEKKQLERDWC